MRMVRMACMALTFFMLLGAISVPVRATELENATPEVFTNNFVYARATESLNISIPAKSSALANSSFPLAAGETVTIQAYYSPYTASVDIGLIDPNGVFHYFNITGGQY